MKLFTHIDCTAVAVLDSRLLEPYASIFDSKQINIQINSQYIFTYSMHSDLYSIDSLNRVEIINLNIYFQKIHFHNVIGNAVLLFILSGNTIYIANKWCSTPRRFLKNILVCDFRKTTTRSSVNGTKTDDVLWHKRGKHWSQSWCNILHILYISFP